MQRLNEQRKLDHRRKIADHLREMSKTSGNEHLNDVADRLDKKAQEHYDKRMEKLNSRDGVSDDADDALAGADDAPGGTPSDTDDALADIDDPSAPADNTLADTGDAPADDAPADDALSDADESPGDDMLDGDAPTGDQIEDVARKLTGRENALDRQLRNEERKFNQRMEAVDRLRQLAEQTGDSQFLDAAERLESAALDHYEQRLAKITEFQQRFNLPDFDSLPVSTPSP
jgi:ribosomal protein L18E